MHDLKKDHRSLAFFVFPVLQFPRNNREYYLTKELLLRNWKILWLVPDSGKNEGVPVEDHILYYNDLDVRGRTYLLPIYLAVLLRSKGIKFLWLSGWSIRSDKEIYWLIQIMLFFGIKTIYDPIDPKALFEMANKQLTDPIAVKKSQQNINRIYRKCSQILCVTPELKTILSSNGVHKSKLFVARWGTDFNVFNPNNINNDFRKRYKIDDKSILIGWLGRMTEFKGIRELLLPLAERIILNTDVHFMIIGDGELFTDVEQWSILKNSNSIRLLDRIPYADAAEFTAALDIYLVSTNPDTDYAKAICPIKCYDAIAVGTTLITTRTPATEHLLKISNNVYLSDYTIDSFEQAVLHVIANIERIREEKKHSTIKGISHQMVTPKIADMLDCFAKN